MDREPTRLAGVMGWPVAHSLSPRLHGYWLREHRVDGAYLPFAVRPDHVVEALRALPKLGIRGVNVTLPHKEAVLRAVDDVDPLAARIGAVNTVTVESDGRLRGRNTDAEGFLTNLASAPDGFDPTAAPAVVLGAGGAARAICVALLDAGCSELRLVNRTRARAEEMRDDLPDPVEVIDWAARGDILDGVGLLVNTTSLGMAGHPPLDIDLAALPQWAVVTDIVYVPLRTPLLSAAAAQGHRTVDGLGMLLHQAVPGFEAWFGVRPRVTPELRAHVLEALG